MGKQTMVKSLDELMGRCRTATNKNYVQKAMAVTEDTLLAARYLLGIPNANDITKKQLETLKPMYMEFIRDVRENKASSIYLRPLNGASAKKPDGGILLLSWILNLFFVRDHCRTSSSSTAPFELGDIADKIASNKTLGRWLRETIASSNRHHWAMLDVCILSLHMIFHLWSNQSKVMYQRKVLFRNVGNDRVGLEELCADLAQVVSRPEATAQTVSISVMVLRQVGRDVDGFTDTIVRSSHYSTFVNAFKRHRDEFGRESYRSFIEELSRPESEQERKQSSSYPAERELNICNAQGCSERGGKLCVGCKLVAYCSKECQAADWKTCHKRVCSHRRR